MASDYDDDDYYDALVGIIIVLLYPLPFFVARAQSKNICIVYDCWLALTMIVWLFELTSQRLNWLVSWFELLNQTCHLLFYLLRYFSWMLLTLN